MSSKTYNGFFKFTDRYAQHGTGMIEVLVLVFIVAVGMLAMGKMHTMLIRDGGTANSRAVATSLAQEKIDDMRGFKWRNDEQASNNGDNCANADIFCFSEIGDNTGGLIPSGAVVIGNTSYNRTWTVTDNSIYKSLTVTVAWTDQNGNHTVVLPTAIYQDDPLLTSYTGGGGGSGGNYGPRVVYNPGAAPDVVAVPIRQGVVNKETSKPLPDVVAAGSSVATSFQTVTFALGSPNYKQQLDDYVTVSCVCQFNNDGAGYEASYFSWDAKSKTLKVKYPSTTVSKQSGETAVNGQHSLCNTCCRDHHDAKNDTSTPLYDPARPDTDYTGGGDHKHYYYADSDCATNPNATNCNPEAGLTAVTTGRYLEACRFLRVDGYFRLMQDWTAIDLVVLPKENYLPTNLTAYQTYVKNQILQHVKDDCDDSDSSDCGSFTVTTSSLPSRNLSSATGTIQLLSRGLYLDRVYSSSAPRDLDDTYYSVLAGKIAASQSDSTKTWLDIVPFNEVNTTLLTSWGSSNGSVVTVTNEPIADIGANEIDYYGVYSRGRATVIGSGNADITAYLLPSNSGLTGGAQQETFTGATDYNESLNADGTIGYPAAIGIDRHDHRSANRLNDSLNISTSSTPGITGEVRLGNARGNLTTLTVTAVASPSGTLTDCSLTGEGNTRGFHCPVTSGFTGKVAISSTTTGAFFDHGNDLTYDAENDGVFSTEITGFSNVTGPVDGGVFWVFSPTAEVRGNINCEPTSACGNITVTTSGNVACTISGTSVTCPVTLTSGTWSGSVTMANNTGFSYILSASCATQGTPSVSVSNVGPTDAASALNMCASSGSTPPSCTYGSITIPSGQSATFYSASTIVWPGTCSSISTTKTCDYGNWAGASGYDEVNCTPTTVAPQPSWTGASNPKSLSWSAIAGADGYRVYSCTTTNKNELTACTPNPSTFTTTVSASYSPVPPSKDTICAYVRANKGGTVSEASGTFCIYYKNPSTYTYTPTP